MSGGPGEREHAEDAHFPRTRSVARSVHDGVARRYLVESPSDAHEFAFGYDRPSRHTRVLGGAPAGHRRRPATKLGVRAGLGVGGTGRGARVGRGAPAGRAGGGN